MQNTWSGGEDNGRGENWLVQPHALDLGVSRLSQGCWGGGKTSKMRESGLTEVLCQTLLVLCLKPLQNGQEAAFGFNKDLLLDLPISQSKPLTVIKTPSP